MPSFQYATMEIRNAYWLEKPIHGSAADNRLPGEQVL